MKLTVVFEINTDKSGFVDFGYFINMFREIKTSPFVFSCISFFITWQKSFGFGIVFIRRSYIKLSFTKYTNQKLSIFDTRGAMFRLPIISLIKNWQGFLKFVKHIWVKLEPFDNKSEYCGKFKLCKFFFLVTSSLRSVLWH